MRNLLALAAAALFAPLGAAADRPDVLVADFEGATYGAGWKTTGTAFGQGPALGTLPNQMPVTGFLGKGLVNSFLGGDDSKGTLTSPEIRIERKFINFLVGGGKFPGKTCIDLMIDGKIVRTATGPNDRPGGSEHLDWASWDVGEFDGQLAIVRIVDDATGGWGHITVDQIVQSDGKKQTEPVRRTIVVDQPYLHLPVKTGAPARKMTLSVGNEAVREFDIQLNIDGGSSLWAFADLTPFLGKTLTIETSLPADSRALDSLKFARDMPGAEKVYGEELRPLFHFTSRFGWLNDPNGLVFHDGEWHLYYQHNPFGVNWGNMHWGHAVSPDLVHWKELGIGLYPRRYGDWAFSGSAAVDRDNTSGWGQAGKPPMVLAYTSTGRGECIAFSTGNGSSWTEFDKNPVVKHSGRDPKLVWHAGANHWVMAVYDEFQGKQWIAFYTSPDLKTWTFASRIAGFFECPDLFELPIANDPAAGKKWVLYAADGKYLTGAFDGKEFHADSPRKKQLWHGKFYAAQSFDNAPSSPGTAHPRRVQIGWANGISFPGMPFNQQMTVPVELSLVADSSGPRMLANPVAELASLREGDAVFTVREDGSSGGQKVEGLLVLADNLDAFEVNLKVKPGSANGFVLGLRGTKLIYDSANGTLTCNKVSAPITKHGEDLVELRIFVDRGSIEVFEGHGRVAMSIAAIPAKANRTVEITPQGGAITVQQASVYRIKSSWEK